MPVTGSDGGDEINITDLEDSDAVEQAYLIYWEFISDFFSYCGETFTGFTGIIAVFNRKDSFAVRIIADKTDVSSYAAAVFCLNTPDNLFR